MLPAGSGGENSWISIIWHLCGCFGGGAELRSSDWCAVILLSQWREKASRSCASLSQNSPMRSRGRSVCMLHWWIVVLKCGTLIGGVLQVKSRTQSLYLMETENKCYTHTHDNTHMKMWNKNYYIVTIKFFWLICRSSMIMLYNKGLKFVMIAIWTLDLCVCCYLWKSNINQFAI